METEHISITPLCNCFSIYLYSKSVSRIINYRYSIFLGKSLKAFYITWMTIYMNRNNSFCSRCNLFLYTFWMMSDIQDWGKILMAAKGKATTTPMKRPRYSS